MRFWVGKRDGMELGWDYGDSWHVGRVLGNCGKVLCVKMLMIML
jgi:hypothetical protein